MSLTVWCGSLIRRQDEQTFFAGYGCCKRAGSYFRAHLFWRRRTRRRGWRSTISQQLWDLPFAPDRPGSCRPEPCRHHRPQGRKRRGVRLLRSKQELERRLGRGSAGSIFKQPPTIHAGTKMSYAGMKDAEQRKALIAYLRNPK